MEQQGVPRRFSFAPGPGPLPAAVMERAQREFRSLPAAGADDEGQGFGPVELTNLDAAGGAHPGVPAESSPAQGVMAEAEAGKVMAAV